MLCRKHLPLKLQSTFKLGIPPSLPLLWRWDHPRALPFLDGTVRDAVLKRVLERLAKEVEKTSDAKMRRRDFMYKVNSAKETMARNGTILYKKPPNGSALKTRKGDLVAQWNRRQSNPSPPQSPSNRTPGFVKDPVGSGDELEVMDDLDGFDDSMSRAEI
jgi:hypothetical protein